MLLFLPEIILLLTGIIFLTMSLGRFNGVILKKTALCCGSMVVLAALAGLQQNGLLFFASYQVDIYSQFFKLLMALAALMVLAFGGDLPGVAKENRAEYYLFLFMSLLGLMMLVSSVELIAVFIALELSSFAVYLMVPLRKPDGKNYTQSEAGIKYILFGVMASGLLLFGMSYLFGLSSSTYLTEIAKKIPDMISQPAAIMAMLMVMAGFFYKLALFPFHFWVPDIYEGSANETAAFIAAVPKIAATAMLIRLAAMLNSDHAALLLMLCSLASMFYGNLAALVQKDLKRMLGYSSIAHAGFVLFGILILQVSGYACSAYYITGYALANLACFLVICSLAADGENLLIEDLRGLNQRSPLLALTLLAALFSLAGIPPFIGFTGKFMLLIGALKHDSRLLVPVILAAVNTAIGIYYYLSVVRSAYFSEKNAAPPVKTGKAVKTLAILLIAAIIYLGIMPSALLDFITRAIGLTG